MARSKTALKTHKLDYLIFSKYFGPIDLTGTMRTLTTILILAFFSSASMAQPIIDQNNFVSAGDVFEYQQLANPLLLDMLDISEEGGENLVWDFSDLPNEGIDVTDSYFPLDSTPDIFNLFFGNPFIAGENFSNQALELAVLDFEIPLPLQVESAFQFYRTDDEGYFITGNAAQIEGIPLLSAYDTLDRVYSFPLGFGDVDTNSFYFLTEAPGIGTFGQSGFRTSQADAWGELMLPGGFYDCLRVRTELDVTDTLYIDFTESGGQIVRPQQVSYTWISPDAGGVVAEAIYLLDSLVSFRYLTNESALSNIEVGVEDFKLYPNPASSLVKLSLPSGLSGKYEILDLTGRPVRTGSLEPISTLDITKLPEGIYLINLSASNMVVTKRLVINR